MVVTTAVNRRQFEMQDIEFLLISERKWFGIEAFDNDL